MFTLSNSLKTAYPDANIGILAIRNTNNPKHHPDLNREKETIEKKLRAKFADFDRAALKSLPVLRAYNDYYRQFKKTYHVQLQLESIVFKGKSIPQVAALVEAMFMAELKNQLLTAGHDLDQLERPIQGTLATGSEAYIGINGKAQTTRANDMMIIDRQGVMSSIVYGPDRRTRITPATQNALFTVYAPPGIDKSAVLAHLQDIQNYVLLITPQADVEHLEVYG